MNELEIIFKDPFLVAINKPHGLMAHKSFMSANTNEFALQKLRNQLNQKVYPVHRLDRKTSGVMLFALSPEINASVQKQFREEHVHKEYLAICRGFFHSQELHYPLTNDAGKTQDAHTIFQCLEQTEINLPFGKFPTSRYSLVRVTPTTGRYHQIRKHCAHLRHPIIGDRPHGCNKQNKLFKHHFSMDKMMLHASLLEITHPIDGKKLVLKATPSKVFLNTLQTLDFTTFTF